MTTAELLPLGQAIPPTVLKKDYIKVEDKPYGQGLLAYSIVLPKDWLQLKIAATDSQLHSETPKLLATFLGPKNGEANPMAQVWCQKLLREIAAGDWLKDFIVRSNATPVTAEIRSPYLADALFLREEGPVMLKTRMSAQVAGDRLFFIQGIAPEDLYPQYADQFGLAMASFKPAELTDNPHVELWQTHRLDNSVKFNAPLSWPERRPQAPPGVDMIDLFNLNANKEPVGNLKGMSVRRSLTQGKKGIDLPALLTAEFTKAGLHITEMETQATSPVPKPFSNPSLRICKGTMPKAQVPRLQNLVVFAVDSPSHHILVGLQTDAPNEGFYEYAVNRRAFDIVLETLQLEGPISEKPKPAAPVSERKPAGRRA